MSYAAGAGLVCCKERSFTVSGTCDTDRCKEQVTSFAVSSVVYMYVRT